MKLDGAATLAKKVTFAKVVVLLRLWFLNIFCGEQVVRY